MIENGQHMNAPDEVGDIAMEVYLHPRGGTTYPEVVMLGSETALVVTVAREGETGKIRVRYSGPTSAESAEEGAAQMQADLVNMLHSLAAMIEDTASEDYQAVMRAAESDENEEGGA